MNIKPLGNRVLVKPLSVEEVTASGIVLPSSESEKTKPNQGVVEAVGNGELIAKYGIKVGDTIVYNGYGIAEVEVGESMNKETYKIVYISDDEDSQAVAVISN